MTRPDAHRPARRTVLTGTVAAGAAALTAPLLSAPAAAGRDRDDGTDRRVRALEERHGARICFWAADHRGRVLAHRAHERAPILSVAKTYVGAAVLRDLDRRDDVLARRIRYTADDLVPHHPVTGERIEEGMTVGELCDATIRYSDNPAANLLLELLGGPRAITRFARSIGDPCTRLDRWETELNESLPGDPRDTTTAAAIGRGYRDLLVGRALDGFDRGTLQRWLLLTTTSDRRFRAAMPRGWRLADKTGSGERGTRNDVGVAWSPDGDPVTIAALLRLDDPSSAGAEESAETAHAELARLALRALG